jgi:hypothetical protein
VYGGAQVRSVVHVWAVWAAGVIAVLAVLRVTGYVGAAAPGRSGGFLWPLFSWDYDLYRYVARHGYTPYPSPTFAFFPVWPAVIRVGGAALAGLLALGASLAAFLGVSALAPDGDRRRVAIALACWPGSFALALAYPDGLALAAAVWACVCAARGRTIGAALLGALAAAARPPGVLVAIPLLARRGSRRAAIGPLAAAVAVHAYFWARSGVPDAFVRAQAGWGRHGLGSRPWLVVMVLACVLVVASTRRLRPLAFVAAVAFVVAKTRSWQTATETLRAAVALPLAFMLFRFGGRYRVWAWYSVAVLAVSLATGSIQSFGRQTLLAFPIAWSAARIGSRWLAACGAIANAALLLTLTHFAP